MTDVAQSQETRTYLKEALRHADVVRLVASSKLRTTEHAGGRVAWREWGEGPVLAMLHGGFGSWLHWVRNVEAMAAHFRVLAPDLPGLGESDPVIGDTPDAAQVAKPLVAGLSTLVTDQEPVRILGFSLGAVISSQVSVALGDRVAKTVLVGPSGLGNLWRNVTTDLIRRHPGMTEFERRATVRHNLLHSMIAKDANIDDLALDIQLDLTSQKRQLLGLPISTSSALTDAIPKLVPRLAFIWGAHDPYLYPDVRTAAATLISKYPGLDVRIVEQAGHWTVYEAADAVNALLLGILLPEKDLKR